MNGFFTKFLCSDVFKRGLLGLIFVFSISSSFACPPCPSGASYSGSGPNTSVAGCKCTNATWVWDGTSCVDGSVSCPSGTSVSGAGGLASPSPCKCNNSGDSWCPTTLACSAGSSCPSGAATYGTGVTTSTAGCRCVDTNHVWNGSACVAPSGCGVTAKTWTANGRACSGNTNSVASGSNGTATDNSGTEQGTATFACVNGTWAASPTSATCNEICAPDGAIRPNPSTGAAEVCSSGAWVARSVTTWCLPPSEIRYDDDEWIRLHQTLFKVQNTGCTPDQEKQRNSVYISGGRVHTTDGADRPCWNSLSCAVKETAPIANASCAAQTIAWGQGSNTCYFNTSSLAHNGFIQVKDNTGPVYGFAEARCMHGTWMIYPGYCGTNAPNCTYTPPQPYVPEMNSCNSSGTPTTQCCSSNFYGYSCEGYNSGCN